MAVRDTLNRVENLVAGAWHLPLTGKAVIDEEELTSLIEDLRRDLPEELEQAEKIIQERENIFKAAQQEAENIVKQAKAKAEKLVDENDIVAKAHQAAKIIFNDSQKQGNDYIERSNQHATQLREAADNYANQVFDQLLEYIRNTYQGVQAAGAELEHSWQILNQAKMQMNQQSAQAQQQPPQDYQQNPPPPQDYQQNQQPPDYQQNQPPQQN